MKDATIRVLHQVLRRRTARGIAGLSRIGANTGRDMESDEGDRRLEMMRQEHRDLDAAIGALSAVPQPDQIQIARLKKRKLRLKDEIAQLHDAMLPDIIA